MNFWSIPAFNFIPSFSMFSYNAFSPMSMPLFDFSSSFYGGMGDCFVKSSSKSSSSGKITDAGGKTKWDKYFLKYCKEFGVDINLARAIRKAETGFLDNSKTKPPEKAVSRRGAQGLMQLMPSTARSYGVTDAFNPEENIKGGVKMLADLSKKFNGNRKLIAAAYNAGPNRACLQRGEIPKFKETQKYVKDVEQYYNEYKAMG